ncbi:ETX/MTX2 family pore-forming toxin [Bacillus wiedmannii]|uniref:ETX/MTX2 family pore-forming toxin n=1 Tax=Bacillus wiedmannii TaxID=1890302 RepID=UPI0001ED26FB|nr:ETX/MTX2 family pore-forming toxin [Bacillus wiedmannii]
MKTCTNNSNPRNTVLLELDDYITHVVKENVVLGPPDLVGRKMGYPPGLGSWRMDSSYFPTPTSSQVPGPPCNTTFTCRYYPSPAWGYNTNSMIAEGINKVIEAETVALAQPIIMDIHNFSNNTNVQQTYYTPEYSEVTTTTVTNSTTSGIKSGTKISASVKFKILKAEFGVNTEVSSEYNFSTTQTITTTTSRTVTFKAQPVVVAPHTTVQVTVLLNRVVYQNEAVPIEADLSGRIYSDDGSVGLDFYPTFEFFNRCCGTAECCKLPDSLKIGSNNKVRFTGIGYFQSDVPSNNFQITTDIIDDATGATISRDVQFVPATFGPILGTTTSTS